METIVLPRDQFEQMKQEINFLRNTIVYKRLLEFEKNIQEKRYFRKDL